MKVSHVTAPNRPYNQAMRTNWALSVIVFLAAGAVAWTADAQELWNGIQIGESKAAILHRYPDAVSSLDREIRGVQPSRENLTVKNFGLGQCRLAVRFVFPDGGGLDAVHVTTVENMLMQPTAVRAKCAKEILDGLNEKYGAPDKAGSQDDRDMTLAVWHRPGGVNIEYTNQNLLGAFVSYSRTQPMSMGIYKNNKSAL